MNLECVCKMVVFGLQKHIEIMTKFGDFSIHRNDNSIKCPQDHQHGSRSWSLTSSGAYRNIAISPPSRRHIAISPYHRHIAIQVGSMARTRGDSTVPSFPGKFPYSIVSLPDVYHPRNVGYISPSRRHLAAKSPCRHLAAILTSSIPPLTGGVRMELGRGSDVLHPLERV